jgi:hypothetical protein
LKSSDEKVRLASELLRWMRQLEPDVIGKQLTVQLLSRTMFAEPIFTDLFAEFLTARPAGSSEGILPLDVFQKYVVPKLLNLLDARCAFSRQKIVLVDAIGIGSQRLLFTGLKRTNL